MFKTNKKLQNIQWKAPKIRIITKTVKALQGNQTVHVNKERGSIRTNSNNKETDVRKINKKI